MAIVFVNRFFFPDVSATSQLLTDLCFDLARQGIAVKVITSRQAIDNPQARLPAHESLHGIEVHRV